jgi:hypothetical protein
MGVTAREGGNLWCARCRHPTFLFDTHSRGVWLTSNLTHLSIFQQTYVGDILIILNPYIRFPLYEDKVSFHCGETWTHIMCTLGRCCCLTHCCSGDL